MRESAPQGAIMPINSLPQELDVEAMLSRDKIFRFLELILLKGIYFLSPLENTHFQKYSPLHAVFVLT